MFLPDNCDAILRLPFNNEKINWISANRERTIIAVLTDSRLYFYLASQHLLLCTFKRSDEDFTERGFFKKLYWRHNSKSVCVITVSNFVYVYTVDISQDLDSFNLIDPSDKSPIRQSPELYLKQRSPIINVSLAVIAKLESQPQCVVSLKDELFVSLLDGWVHRLGWNGDVLQEFSFSIRHIAFSVDQISAKADKFPQSSLCVMDMVYCPLIGGLCIVLNDGRAALLVSKTPHFQPSDISAVWAGKMSDALCCTANHKFRLVYFGCQNGDIAAYSLDDANGALIQIFRIKLSAKNGTEYLTRIGAVRQIQCVPQGNVLVVIWGAKKQSKQIKEDADVLQLNGLGLMNCVYDVGEEEIVLSDCPPAVAIFSPFGAQWWSSLENTFHSYQCCSYTSVEWGQDGYQLWLGTHGRGLFNINFVHSLPDYRERVVMIGSDRVYLSPSRFYDEKASAPHFIWEVCKVPYEYIASNWPLKYVGMDEDCNRVLVAAGTRGFCFCSLKNFKWRLFRKEAQELDLCLTADIIVYKEFVLVAVCNTLNEGDTIYAFNLAEQLDKDLAAASLPVSRVLIMNLSQDYLLTFDVASVVTIYSMKQTVLVDSNAKQSKYLLEIDCYAEIRIAELLPHPSCMVSIQLTQLHYHLDMAEFCPGYDTLLINVSGHLLLLSPLHSRKDNFTDQQNTLQLHPPTLIASNVERVWTHLTHRKILHLNKALWINTGCKKMQVWLSLSQQVSVGEPNTAKSSPSATSVEMNATTRRSFISKRIMLPIDLNLYPLAIDEDCLVCGAESFTVGTSPSYDEFVSFSSKSRLTNVEKSNGEKNEEKLKSDDVKLLNNDGKGEKDSNDNVDLCNHCDNDHNENVDISQPAANIYFPTISARSLIRVTEVFLHHLLKQLLKRNLGTYALSIASACRTLPYFSHVLELLLHDVLDEEATSSEPIPDPLLPTIISFIHEFPEYLQTVVHCARKTELAFWNLLFSVSHHPRDIFRKCVADGDLDTAACCLILLQSMEPMGTSSQCYAQLLEEALAKRRWALARDIVRFMHSIDRSELEANLESPPIYQKRSLRGNTIQKCSILPTDTSATDELMFNSSNGSGGVMSGKIMRSTTNVSSGTAIKRLSSEIGAISTHTKSSTSNVHSISANISQQSNAVVTSGTCVSRTSPNNTSTTHYKPQAPMRMNSTVRLLTKNPSLDSGNFCNESAANSLSDFGHFDEILMRHGTTLLEDYALRDFGAFASHLDVDLKAFFGNPHNAFNVPADEFPLVLMKLHAQFAWPYPMTTNGSVIFANPQMRSSASSYSDLSGTNSTELKPLATATPNNSMVSLAASNGNSFAIMNGGNDEGAVCDDSISLSSFSTTAADTISTSLAAEQSFSWKVFKKLCGKSRGTRQSEAELVFLMNWLAETDALEWIYLLCILKQDAKAFNEKLMNELNNQKRLALFLKNVREGTAKIYAWAESKCPAYAPVIRVFKEFLEI